MPIVYLIFTLPPFLTRKNLNFIWSYNILKNLISHFFIGIVMGHILPMKTKIDTIFSPFQFIPLSAQNPTQHNECQCHPSDGRVGSSKKPLMGSLTTALSLKIPTSRLVTEVIFVIWFLLQAAKLKPNLCRSLSFNIRRWHIRNSEAELTYSSTWHSSEY